MQFKPTLWWGQILWSSFYHDLITFLPVVPYQELILKEQFFSPSYCGVAQGKATNHLPGIWLSSKTEQSHNRAIFISLVLRALTYRFCHFYQKDLLFWVLFTSQYKSLAASPLSLTEEICLPENHNSIMCYEYFIVDLLIADFMPKY